MQNVITVVKRLFAETGKRLDYAQDLGKMLETFLAPAAHKLAFLNKEPFRTVVLTLAGLKDKRYKFCRDLVELMGAVPFCDMTGQDGQTRFVWIVTDQRLHRRSREETVRLLTDATPKDAQDRVLILFP